MSVYDVAAVDRLNSLQPRYNRKKFLRTNLERVKSMVLMAEESEVIAYFLDYCSSENMRLSLTHSVSDGNSETCALLCIENGYFNCLRHLVRFIEVENLIFLDISFFFFAHLQYVMS